MMLSENSDFFHYVQSSTSIDPGDYKYRQGDIFLSSDAFPMADCIVSPDILLNNPFVVHFLLDYLNFLEIVVLNERLIIGSPPIIGIGSALLDSVIVCERIQEIGKTSEGREKILKEKKLNLFPRFRLFPLGLEIEDTVRRTLLSRGILDEVEIRGPSMLPVAQVERRLQYDKVLAEEFEKWKKHFAKKEHDDILARCLALMYLSQTQSVGNVLYLSEAFGRGRTPYVFGKPGSPLLRRIEVTDLKSRKGVLAYLKDHLDTGARREVKRLTQLGVSTVFPETPIAMQIVMNSTSPEDLLSTALQLRDDYIEFRSVVGQLERELLSENITLAKKMKLVHRLEAMANDIWPRERQSVRRETVELTGLLDLIGSFDLGDIRAVVKTILGFPMDRLVRALRKRKVRVLHKTKKQFLRSRGCSQKIASIFNLSEEGVREAIAADGPITADMSTVESRYLRLKRGEKARDILGLT